MFTPSIPGRVVFKRNARGGRQIPVSLSQNERSTFSRVTPVFVPSLPVWGRGTSIFPDKTVILTNPNAVCPKNDQMTNPATEKPRMTRIPRTSSYGGSHGGCESTDHRSPITDHSVRAKQRDPESIRGFTLLELLIVVGIMGLLLVLIAPAFTTIKGGTDVTSAAYTIKGVLDTARTYAKANNTYTWVGFFEEDVITLPRPTQICHA